MRCGRWCFRPEAGAGVVVQHVEHAEVGKRRWVRRSAGRSREPVICVLEIPEQAVC